MREREIFHEKIIKKAWSDPDFKQALKTNPKLALKKEFELGIPDDITLEVIEESENHFYLVLPATPSSGESSTPRIMW